MAHEPTIKDLERRIEALTTALATTITWIALSAGSPLGVKDAQELLELVIKAKS